MPSLTSVPSTCPATQTTAVRQFPSARLAPNRARAISSGQAVPKAAGMNAEAASEPTGSWRRFTTLVLAQRSTAA